MTEISSCLCFKILNYLNYYSFFTIRLIFLPMKILCYLTYNVQSRVLGPTLFKA
jgi:hypothetical protein